MRQPLRNSSFAMEVKWASLKTNRNAEKDKLKGELQYKGNTSVSIGLTGDLSDVSIGRLQKSYHGSTFLVEELMH